MTLPTNPIEAQVPELRLQGQLRDLEQRISSLERGGDYWHVIGASGEIAFGTGFAAYTGATGWQSPRFYKANNRVYLQGMVARVSGSGGILFTLPAGYRPAATILFPVWTGDPATAARLDIFSDGGVVLQSGSVNYIGLSHISFRVG